MSYSRHIFGKHASHTAFLLQRLLLLILAVTSAWTKAPAEATASTGTMTSRLIPVHSSGTEAVLEMTTVSKQKKNARRLALYPEQVTFFFFLILTTNGDTVFLYSFLNVICLQQDKRREAIRGWREGGIYYPSVCWFVISVWCISSVVFRNVHHVCNTRIFLIK